MMKRRASEIFAAVDPNLTVIDGGTRRRHRYKPLTETDWDRAEGVLCQKCARDTLQVKDGLCPQCYRAREGNRIECQEDHAMRAYYSRKIREGTLDLHRMEEGLL